MVYPVQDSQLGPSINYYDHTGSYNGHRKGPSALYRGYEGQTGPYTRNKYVIMGIQSVMAAIMGLNGYKKAPPHALYWAYEGQTRSYMRCNTAMMDLSPVWRRPWVL